MTRRAFDTRGNLADQLFRCLETPYSDVLEHNTVLATFWNGPRMKNPGAVFGFRLVRSQPGPQNLSHFTGHLKALNLIGVLSACRFR